MSALLVAAAAGLLSAATLGCCYIAIRRPRWGELRGLL